MSDSIDDSMRMFERIAREGLYRLTIGVVKIIDVVYLRKLSLNDMQQLYVRHMKKDMVFRVCLEALIAHTGNGKIVMCCRKVNMQVIIMEHLRWY